MTYRPPVEEMAFLLTQVAGLDQLRADGLAPEIDDDLIASLFDQAGRFAAEAVAPLNRPGDIQGVTLAGGEVTTPDGYRDTYRQWREAGWNAVDAPVEWGGMGLPVCVGAPILEMWTAACMAFTMSPVLTQGAVEVLEDQADETLRELYLAKLVSGEWSATMSLTEPQAGSDLAGTQCRAEPAGDGTYRLFGQKIFISYGEHDLTDNIIHLVLARLPGAPGGTRGLSLFLAPKWLPGPGEAVRNDLQCIGVEHKLGIHGSPTCTIAYGDGGQGATAWLLGEPHKGLAGMFIMMNRARLCTGLQGVGIAERATQKAFAFARERRQGRAPGVEGPAPIIAHPDVRRMLLDMRACVLAARSIAYSAAVAIDRARLEPDPDRRAAAAGRAALLTPIVKAWCTQVGFDVASTGVQVHGGMGFIEETGAAQHMRDGRIALIYEGTNGIQAVDLVMRKLMRDGGEAALALIEELKSAAGQAALDGALGPDAKRLAPAVEHLAAATAWLLAAERSEAERLASAAPFLRLFALTLGTILLARAAGSPPGRFAKPADMVLVARHAVGAWSGEIAGLADLVQQGGWAVAQPEALSAYE